MFLRRSLIPFLFLSLGGHLLLLFLSWPGYPTREQSDEPIPVTFLPASKANAAQPVPKTQKPRTRASKVSPQPAKRTTPLLQRAAKEPLEPAEKERNEELTADDRREKRERQDIIRRPLPNWKELLPPATWSRQDAETNGEGAPVLLNTPEPKYRSYFTIIKRAIELVWEYPEPALRHGLEGKLVLEFTILRNGALEGTRLVRSSGFTVLDEEAIRAVQTASPFQPIPPWIGGNRLEIIASFEYYDNRVKYGLMP